MSAEGNGPQLHTDKSHSSMSDGKIGHEFGLQLGKVFCLFCYYNTLHVVNKQDMTHALTV